MIYKKDWYSQASRFLGFENGDRAFYWKLSSKVSPKEGTLINEYPDQRMKQKRDLSG